jgi:transcriptional regulator with XRE-family HTH domain
MDNVYLNVGLKLKALRGDRNQADFAALLGLPVRTYIRYELGEREPPLETLTRIAKVTGSSIDWIAGLASNASAPSLVGEPQAEPYDAKNILQNPVQSDISDVGLNPTRFKIMELLKEMSEDDCKEILKYIEKEKLLKDLLSERRNKIPNEQA